MARKQNTLLKPIPEDRRIYRVRATRSLIWPRNISARNRLFADSGELVDLTHPVMHQVFATQLALKAERVAELPDTANIKGMESVPIAVAGRIKAHDLRAAQPTTEDELAEALGIDEKDLPDIDRPERIARAKEQVRSDIRKEVEQQVRAELAAETKAKAKQAEKELRESIRAELEAEYELVDEDEGDEPPVDEVETEDDDLPSAKG